MVVLHSIDKLRAWVAHGPLRLDGHTWFGVGHWFVAIASDAGGVFIRDSSGYDTRYLSWARLYGEVGWSGWAVGVQSQRRTGCLTSRAAAAVARGRDKPAEEVVGFESAG